MYVYLSFRRDCVFLISFDSKEYAIAERMRFLQGQEEGLEGSSDGGKGGGKDCRSCVDRLSSSDRCCRYGRKR